MHTLILTYIVVNAGQWSIQHNPNPNQVVVGEIILLVYMLPCQHTVASKIYSL